jgi:protein-disulfide isomerase
MKKFLALAAPMLLGALAVPFAAPLVAAPQKPWTAVATPAPQGSYVIGNPKAKVKLIEYVSYTCPHCGHFARDSAAVLKGKMIASGSTSLEVRNSIHDRYDLIAATLARCSGPAVFPKMHELLYARQDEWLNKAVAFDAASGQSPAGNTQGEKMRTLANGAGLTDIAKAAGMTDAAINACFATEANLAKTLQVAQALQGKINATPTFELNGKLIERTDWAALEPMLRAAGAR